MRAMQNPSSSKAVQSVVDKRGWLITGGIVMCLVGVLAVILPALASLVIEQFIAALCLVTGVFSIFSALFGKEVPQRVWTGIAGVICLAVGLLLFFNAVAGIVGLTIVLGAIFVAEGFASFVLAFRLRANKGWIWILLNGVVALILGALILARVPGDSLYVLGLLFGINSIFFGASLLSFAMGLPKSGEAAAAPAQG